jgi:hypothetical protein
MRTALAAGVRAGTLGVESTPVSSVIHIGYSMVNTYFTTRTLASIYIF